MFSRAELKAQMIRKGYTQKSLAYAIGIAPKTMWLKMQSGKFNTEEISKIMKLLDITDPVPIFFAKEE